MSDQEQFVDGQAAASEAEVLDEHQQRLAAMQARMSDFSARWREWAHANQPNVVRCNAHAYDRRVNEQRSIGESWKRQEMVIFFNGCPGCWREKNQPNQKPKTKKPSGVKMPHKND